MSMNSFSSLNSLGTIAYTDNRQPNVIFTWPAARNISTITKTSNVFNVERKIDIAEIIDSDYTNIKYNIDLSAVAGATLTWNYLPDGAITTSTGNVYTVQPITTVAEWNSIAAPTITLPEDFQGSFFYTVSIQYTTLAGIQTVSWTVGTYVPVSDMSTVATLSTSPAKYKGIVNEEFATIFSLNGVGYDFISFAAALTAQGSFSVSALRTARITAGLSSIVSATIQSKVNGLLRATLVTDGGNFVASGLQREFLSNTTVSRTYLSNQENDIFSTSVPTPTTFIEAQYGTCQYTVTITVSAGTLNGASSNTYSNTGTVFTVVSQAFANLQYYPAYNQTSNFTISYTVTIQPSVGPTFTRSYSQTVNYAGVGTPLTTTLYDFTASDTWTPSVPQQLYGEMIYAIVGGGGGASLPFKGDTVEIPDILIRSGGGGGQVIQQLTYVPISLSSYPIVVGTGGAAQETKKSYPDNQAPSGGNSSFNSLTALGGGGGRHAWGSDVFPRGQFVLDIDGQQGNLGFSGGGDCGSNLGGYNAAYQDSSVSDEIKWAGGGGGGAGGAGNPGELDDSQAPNGPFIFIRSIGGSGGGGVSSPSTLYNATLGRGGAGGGVEVNPAATANTVGSGGNGFGTRLNGADGGVRIRVRQKV